MINKAEQDTLSKPLFQLPDANEINFICRKKAINVSDASISLLVTH
jgi:hypothetical protein